MANLEITPILGDFVRPDGWSWSEQLVASDWDQAPFRITTRYRTGGAYLPTPSGYVELAVRIEVTARTWRRIPPKQGGGWGYRVRVTFVGDGEPDTHTSGWLIRNHG